MGIFAQILLVTLFLAAPAYAWPPEVAPEFNFSNDEIDQAWLAQENRGETSNEASFRLQKKFRDLVAKRCAGCVITLQKDLYGERMYRVELKSGWQFEITLDPGVIEIKAKPIRLDQFANVKPDMDKLVWEIAEDLGLKGKGGGHLNFGIESTFGGDSRLFRDFLSDYFNNPGLSQGVLGYSDFANAPHPEELEPEQAKRLKKILDGFKPEKDSVSDLAARIFKEVYHKTTMFRPPEKFQAVNLSTVAQKGSPWPRMELRAIPMQKDSEHFEQLARLFAARIEYLKSPRKVLYHPENFHGQTVFDNVKDFYLYVMESGLDWNEYRHLVSSDPAYQMALEGLDFYIEKGGLKPPTGCAASFGRVLH
jgi:hypothetical protein